jgi:hypothetical protein
MGEQDVFEIISIPHPQSRMFSTTGTGIDNSGRTVRSSKQITEIVIKTATA